MPTNYLALDVGQARIGVAVASAVARLPRPLDPLNNNDQLWQQLEALIASEEIGKIVVGLPRNLNGHDTSQTDYSRAFAIQLEERFHLPTVLQDEALTSVAAEAELKKHKKPVSIDSLAASYILNDYLSSLGDELK